MKKKSFKTNTELTIPKLLTGVLLVVFVALSAYVYFGSGAYATPEITADPNPPENPRQPAEFEPMEAVLIRYPTGIPYSMVAELSNDVEIVTIVFDEEDQQEATEIFVQNNVNMENVEFLFAPTNGYWTRDYTPIFIFTDTGPALIDFSYNKNRPMDNNIPLFYAEAKHLPIHKIPMAHTGGNLMTDGYGLSVSTDLLLDNNPGIPDDGIGQLLEEYLGITNPHFVPDANGEYIRHIDCWAKFLSPDTIVIREVPPEHSQHNALESAADYFKSQTTSYGTPFNVVRVYAPNDESYANSLILNSKVFVPLEGTEWDDDALQTYQEAMPGYEVIGVEELEGEEWLSTDSLHCRVKGIPDSGMLYINHVPIHEGWELDADIIPYSGEELVANSTVVYYRLGEGEWGEAQLLPVGGYEYTAVIPEQPEGTLIYYYVHAEDESGRSENHPYMGEMDPHMFVAG
jgi:agmatine deiminase